jgi:AraC-like DNA-binding protein
MEPFISEALTMYNISRILELGVSENDIIKITGVDLSRMKEPLLTRKCSHKQGLMTYRLLKELGYQENNELSHSWKMMDKSGFHKSFILNSESLSEALNKLIMIGKNHESNLSIDVSPRGDRVFIYHKFNDERDSYYSPFAGMAIIAQVFQESFNVSMQELDLEFGFRHSHIPNEDLFVSLVTDKIRLNSDADYISIRKDFWFQKNERFNLNLSSFFDEQYKIHYGDNCTQDDFLIRVHSYIAANKVDFECQANIEYVAGKLNMSRSTLYRHLADRGLTFKQIVEDIKKSDAMRYIKNTSLNLDEISDRLGYANMSAFNRAFKRWYNKTPTWYRQYK